jgi:hypothetical protein
MTEETFSTKRPNEVQHRPDGTTAILLECKNGEIFECIVDTADYDLIKNYRWHCEKHRHVMYAASTAKNRQLAIHRLIVPGCERVDHKDHDGLNNRRDNLRPATVQQNAKNRMKHRERFSRFKGVAKSNWRAKKFKAAIRINSKLFHLGYFDSEIEAAARYNEAAKAGFGEFAHLNCIPEQNCEPPSASL